MRHKPHCKIENGYVKLQRAPYTEVDTWATFPGSTVVYSKFDLGYLLESPKQPLKLLI